MYVKYDFLEGRDISLILIENLYMRHLLLYFIDNANFCDLTFCNV